MIRNHIMPSVSANSIASAQSNSDPDRPTPALPPSVEPEPPTLQLPEPEEAAERAGHTGEDATIQSRLTRESSRRPRAHTRF